MHSKNFSPSVISKIESFLKLFKAAEATATELFYRFFNFFFKLFLKVFPRPTLPNEDLRRSATVFADFFAFEIVYTTIDFVVHANQYKFLGLQNTIMYIGVLVLIRYHAMKGRLKLSVSLFGLSVIYFYLLVTADTNYFEHLQASNLYLVVAFATITMGPRSGMVALTASLALFWGLRLASESGILTPLDALLENASSLKQEWLIVSANCVEMYIFCWLVRSHIFSQLNLSLAREKGISAQEEKARKAADKAEGEKTRFIASASHDLRQPVSSLVLNFEAHLAAHPEYLTEPAVTDMRSSIDSLSTMLDSILTVSKLDAKVLVPVNSMVSINEILERCYAANAASARQKHLSLRLISTDLFCETDPAMLFRAVNNIVNNAVKYTNSGGIIIGVRRRYGGQALFVMDSGIGIPEESLSSIYDEFTMLLDSSRKSGSGLGLSIVRKILGLLGMKIHTLSKVGVGSTFYIELPKTYSIPSAVRKPLVSRKLPEVARPQVSVTAKTPFNGELKGLLVAVVDDVEVLRKTICRILELHGMRTVDVAGWSDLESVLMSERPDLIITDYKLEHNVTGYDVILAARKLISDELPCFIITGDTSPALVHEMSDRGVDVYYKPVTSDTLLEAIRHQLSA